MGKCEDGYEEFTEGETYYRKVDRISNAGNAIISLSGKKHLNLGKIGRGYQGKVVKFKYLGNGQVKVVDTKPNTPPHQHPLKQTPTEKKNDLLSGKL